MLMYEKGKLRPIEIILGIWGGKENDRVSEFNYDILKNFYKCHNVPSAQQ
jgi:hypothetical protein